MTELEFNALKNQTVAALFQVGKCYGTGDGVGKDEAEAVRWYRMAAEQGCADAMFELSKCHTFGIGVRRNRASAAKWLQKAAEHDHVRAMFILGNWYLSKQRGIEYNPRKAAWWFRRAADKGDAWGMFHLGECYENGIGIKKDPDEAYLWYCRAVTASPEDEQLYQSVQNRFFDTNMKEIREKLLKEDVNLSESVSD